MKISLNLPARPPKPRRNGKTMVIDSGAPTHHFVDAVNSYGDYIDLVKFGWATALVTKDFETKRDALRDLGIDCCFGGTMFEKFVSQNQFEEFLMLCRTHEMPVIEISNGTIEMSNTEKSEYIGKLFGEFTIFSEVGFKDAGRSDELTSEEWINCISEDIAAGSSTVITEARESGKSGIFTADGDLKEDIIGDIANSKLDIDRILFEAPNKMAQTYFIKRLGANVNLGNIALDDVIGLETLRLGLRADTLSAFEN